MISYIAGQTSKKNSSRVKEEKIREWRKQGNNSKNTPHRSPHIQSLHVYQYQFRDDNLSCPVLTSRIYDDVDVVDEKNQSE